MVFDKKDPLELNILLSDEPDYAYAKMGTETIGFRTAEDDYEQVKVQTVAVEDQYEQVKTKKDPDYEEMKTKVEEAEVDDEEVKEKEQEIEGEEQEVAEDPVYINLGKFNHVTYSHLTLYSSQC